MSVSIKVTITHDGPQELEIGLHEYMASRNQDHRYFISKRTREYDEVLARHKEDYHYLHKDGTIHRSTKNHQTNQWNGWYRSLHEVQLAIDLYTQITYPPQQTIDPENPLSLSEVSGEVPPA